MASEKKRSGQRRREKSEVFVLPLPLFPKTLREMESRRSKNQRNHESDNYCIRISPQIDESNSGEGVREMSSGDEEKRKEKKLGGKGKFFFRENAEREREE